VRSWLVCRHEVISLLSSGVRLLEMAGKNSQTPYLLGHDGAALQALVKAA